MSPRKIHPAQRYPLTTGRDYEYIGSADVYDVFWIPGERKVLVKFSSVVGENFNMVYGQTRWVPGYENVRSKPPFTDEQVETFWGMARCFAQANRPEEWDATTETSAPAP